MNKNNQITNKKSETIDAKNPFYKELWFIITTILLSIILLFSVTFGLYLGLRIDAKISGFKIDNMGRYYDEDDVAFGVHKEFDFDNQMMSWSYSAKSFANMIWWDGEVEVELFLSDVDIFSKEYRIVGSILLKDFTSTELYVSPNTSYHTEFSINEGFIELAEYSQSIVNKGYYSYFLFDTLEITDLLHFYNSSTGELESVWNSHIIFNDYLFEQEYMQKNTSTTLKYQQTASYYYSEDIIEYTDDSSPNRSEVEEYENGVYYSYVPILGGGIKESYNPGEFKFENSLYIS